MGVLLGAGSLKEVALAELAANSRADVFFREDLRRSGVCGELCLRRSSAEMGDGTWEA